MSARNQPQLGSGDWRRTTAAVQLAITRIVADGDNRAMSYDADLANRVRELIASEPDLSEMEMFGGLAFLLSGNMAVAVSGRGGLMLRVAPQQTESLLSRPFAAPMVMGGRAVDGWLRVQAEGVKTKAQLRRWVERGVGYARTLPPKG